SGDKDFLGGQGWYDNAIVVDPYDDATVYVAGVNILKYDVTQDSILTSTVIADPYNSFGGPNNSSKVHPDHHNLTVVKTDVANSKFRLIDGNDGGVTYSDDKGVTFIKTLSGGYNTSQFYGVDKKNGSDQYIGGTQDNGSWVSPASPNSSSSWFSAPSGDGFEAAWNYSNSLQLMESSQYNSIYRSTDGGTVWKNINYNGNVKQDVIPNGSGKAPFITKIASSKLAPNLVFVIGALNGVNGVSRSTDFGATWTGVAIPSNGWTNTNSANQVQISLKDPSVVWAANTIYNSGYTFSVSVDSGKTFSVTQPSTLAPGAWISGFATDPADKNTAYALYSVANSPKILKTTDLGQTWTELSGFGANASSSNGFPDVAVFCLLVMPTNPNIIWAGTDIGIFESRDAGATWNYANNGLPAVAVWQMKDINGQIVVATHGRGVWSVPENEVVTGIETNTSVIPTNYSLSQNYPNPFNPSTKIKFNLPSSSNVKLTIYDITGRKVTDLVNQELSAGVHTVDFDASNISSGVYFYRIQAGSFVQSKKMILMK
ncbi:MAG TPA: T9SS type A sorting domain-containing protein, partial [Ignavibacteriaceae bacterium]|nr:T9SS type A sorting domain-containing protein [Ignavibacteriaceae bacterium]